VNTRFLKLWAIVSDFLIGPWNLGSVFVSAMSCRFGLRLGSGWNLGPMAKGSIFWCPGLCLVTLSLALGTWAHNVGVTGWRFVLRLGSRAWA